jgi:hypothetical protein
MELLDILKIIAYIFSLPFLLIFSLFGCIFFVFLLPFKLLCSTPHNVCETLYLCNQTSLVCAPCCCYTWLMKSNTPEASGYHNLA